MLYCDLTLPTPEENLACDEVLLDLCEAGEIGELLRLWEPIQYFVVLGYANRTETEINLPFCRQHTIPILRRCTGGGTVLQGPGCLNYSLILRLDSGRPVQSITSTNEFILARNQRALAALLQAPVEQQGQTDLALGGLKFSGNAQRRRGQCLLFHGAFLLDLDLSLMEQALPLPARQPRYRLDRSHTDFLVNLKLPAHLLKAALRKTWEAADLLSEIPFDCISQLAQEKYAREEWTLKF